MLGVVLGLNGIISCVVVPPGHRFEAGRYRRCVTGNLGSGPDTGGADRSEVICTHVNLQVFVKIVGEHQVMGHREPVRFHRVVVPVVRRAHIRVVEVRDAVLGGSHRGRDVHRGPVCAQGRKPQCGEGVFAPSTSF